MNKNLIIKKYGDYIREDFTDTPEEYVKTALLKIKKKIESFFEPSSGEDEYDGGDDDPNRPGMKVKKMSDALADGKKKSSDKISFSDLNLNLESSELSKYSAVYDSITIKYSDPNYMYNLFITIPVSSGVSTKDNFSSKDIEECTYKFKKYDLSNFDLIGQLGPKKVKIEEIDEDFLIEIKIELDDEFGDEEEKLEIES
jgi:hypothetical protein